METKKIYLVLIIIFFIFGLIISGIMGYTLGLKRVRFVTETPTVLPKEIFMRAGNVTKIEGNVIFLNSGILGENIDPKTGETITETLKVSVNESTIITSSLNPESEQPSEAKFEDIKVGSVLYVFSSENIKNKKEFLASEITILE